MNIQRYASVHTIWRLCGDETSGIYQITNRINGKKYVGSAVRFRNRWALHVSLLESRKHHNQHLQNAWAKHGEEVFEFSIIEFVADKSKLIEREQFWITSLNPEYNILKVAGNVFGRKWSAEQRVKFRASMTGKRHSQATKDKISATKKAFPQAPLVFTPEIRAKISMAMKGNTNGRGRLGLRKSKLLVKN